MIEERFSKRASTIDELRGFRQNMIQLFSATVGMATGMAENEEGKWVYTPDAHEDPAEILENLAVILDRDGPMNKMTSSLMDGGKLGSALLSYDGLNEEKARHTDTCTLLDNIITANDIELKELRKQLFAMTKEQSVIEAVKVDTTMRQQGVVSDLLSRIKELNSVVHVLQQDNMTLKTVQSQSAMERDETIARVLAEDAKKEAANKEAADKMAADKEAANKMAEAAEKAYAAEKAVVATTKKEMAEAAEKALAAKMAKFSKFSGLTGLFEEMVIQAKEDKNSAGPNQHVFDQWLTSKSNHIVFDAASKTTSNVVTLRGAVLAGDSVGDTQSLMLTTQYRDGQAPVRDTAALEAFQARLPVATQNVGRTFQLIPNRPMEF